MKPLHIRKTKSSHVVTLSCCAAPLNVSVSTVSFCPIADFDTPVPGQAGFHSEAQYILCVSDSAPPMFCFMELTLTVKDNTIALHILVIFR